MDMESTPLTPFDEREKSELQKIYNKFKFVSDVPDFTIAEIKEIRHKLGLSQSMLATLLGVAQRTVESWEAGHRIPVGPARRLMQILKADTDAMRRAGIAEW
jgi:DNA-binding transcriptional regulator YiaG